MQVYKLQHAGAERIHHVHTLLERAAAILVMLLCVKVVFTHGLQERAVDDERCGV